jgi:hypothetical protein
LRGGRIEECASLLDFAAGYGMNNEDPLPQIDEEVTEDDYDAVTKASRQVKFLQGINGRFYVRA